MSLRSKHHRLERFLILERTAMQHIAKHGVYGLRVHFLAKELGYTTAALYRYYPSKEALIAALQKKSLVLLQTSLLNLQAQAHSFNSTAKILLTTRFYASYAQNSPASFALNSSVFSHPTNLLHGEQRAQIISSMKQLLVGVQKQLEGCITGATFEHAIGLWSALHGAMLTQKYHNDLPIPSPEFIVTSLLCAWGVSPSAIRQAQQALNEFSTHTPLSHFSQLDSLELK